MARCAKREISASLSFAGTLAAIVVVGMESLWVDGSSGVGWGALGSTRGRLPRGELPRWSCRYDTSHGLCQPQPSHIMHPAPAFPLTSSSHSCGRQLHAEKDNLAFVTIHDVSRALHKLRRSLSIPSHQLNSSSFHAPYHPVTQNGARHGSGRSCDLVAPRKHSPS